jgi:hypothetical protein
MLVPTFVAIALLAEAEADATLQVARAVIEHQEESIRSWIVDYSCDLRADSSRARAKPIHQIQECREARRGLLFRLDSQVTLNALDSSDVDRNRRTFDGEAYRTYDRVNKTGTFTTRGTQPNSFTDNAYLSTRTLGAMLREHADDTEAKWVQFEGRRLLSVSWDENDGYSRRTYDLDPDAAYQPRRFTLEEQYPDGAYPDGRESGIFVGEVKEFLRRGDFVIPSVVVITHDETYPQDRTVRSLIKEVRIASIEINPEIDESEFTIEFPDGTSVYDADRKVKFVVGQPGSERRVNPRPAEELAPRRAGPAYELWADWRVWLAFAALCLALLIWVKKRRLA